MHIGVINAVKTINKIDIPSTPIWKFIKFLIHTLFSINWNSDIVGSNKYQSKIAKKKLIKEEKIAMYLEFFSIFSFEPFVKKIKKAPMNGIKIIAERIGKFI